MSGPYVQGTSNPAVLAGGEFGAVVQSTNTSGVPAAIVDGNLTVNGTITGAITGAATQVTITNDATTNATMYPVWVTANTGNLPPKVSSTKLSFNPSTGLLTATGLAGTLSTAAQPNVTSLGTQSVFGIAANTPANAGATGVTGTLAWDATHFYVCVATNTWVRATFATW